MANFDEKTQTVHNICTQCTYTVHFLPSISVGHVTLCKYVPFDTLYQWTQNMGLSPHRACYYTHRNVTASAFMSRNTHILIVAINEVADFRVRVLRTS